jgi:hypothetical protein
VPVARAARRFAGANPDLSTATAAVHRSVASLERARDAAARLDAYLDAMKRSGVLKEGAKLVPPPTAPDPYIEEAYRLWAIKQQGK